jgi:hypothetical protein
LCPAGVANQFSCGAPGGHFGAKYNVSVPSSSIGRRTRESMRDPDGTHVIDQK